MKSFNLKNFIDKIKSLKLTKKQHDYVLLSVISNLDKIKSEGDIEFFIDKVLTDPAFFNKVDSVLKNY